METALGASTTVFCIWLPAAWPLSAASCPAEGEVSSLNKPDKGADAIELQPFYHHVKNSIVRPKQVVVSTRYFWEKWAPRLGPTLTVLVVRLRMHCYYNQATSERRDWCFPTQQTLAEEVGVSRWTVMRELKKPLAKQFVRIQYRSRYDAVRQRTVRISSLYHVAMDDPLVEEDRERAASLLDQGGKSAVSQLTDCQSRRVQPATPTSEGNLPPEEEPEEVPLNAAAVARELINEHVSAPVAQRLAQQFPASVIRDKMALVRQLKEQRQQLRNVPGFLRRAIEEDYQPLLAATGTEDGVPAPRPLLELRRPSAGCARPSLPAQPPQDPSGVDVWQLATAALAADMRPAAFAQWLAPSKLLSYGDGYARIAVPDARVRRYIDQRLRPAIEAALAAACGEPVSLEVVIAGEKTGA